MKRFELPPLRGAYRTLFPLRLPAPRLRPKSSRPLGLASLAAALALAVPVTASTAVRDVTPAQPNVPSRLFALKDFGAVADGKTLNTDAFARAVAAAKTAGGGTLTVGPGDYLTGRIVLCSNLRLQLDAGARILFSTNPADYPREDQYHWSQLSINGVHDVIVAGAGTIDGQGEAWWALVRQQLAESMQRGEKIFLYKGSRPWMLVAENSQRIRVEGITLKNSPMFQSGFIGCEDVTIDQVKIFAPEDAYNTDGIDPIGSRRVRITRCEIDTGDDCVAIKASRRVGPCTDILVADCTFRNGHGCSIGSGTGPGVSNLIVRNCTFEGTDMGIRLKSARDRGGIVEHLLYTDLVMKNVRWPIVLSSYYPGGLPSPAERAISKPRTENTPVWRNITIRNVTATGSEKAGNIVGLPEAPAENITLENVTIEAPIGLLLEQIKGLVLRKVRVTTPSGEGITLGAGVSDVTRED